MTILQQISVVIFCLAIIHTFSTKYFEKLSLISRKHSGLWKLLAEVEVVFGFWSLIMIVIMYYLEGGEITKNYLNSRNFVEPLFIFAIMVVAGTNQILQLVKIVVQNIAKIIPAKGMIRFYFVTLFLVPLFGSLITEPAAMTLAALILGELFYSQNISSKLKYATIGVLFVNVSVGGVLTNFAAPPVLMVAGKWNWNLWFMFSNFGWRAILIVFINSLLVTFYFRNELEKISEKKIEEASKYSFNSILIHLIFLLGIVYFAHYPVIFLSIFLFFLGISNAYPKNNSKLLIREGLMVAFFLSGLVVIGGQQQWWLQKVLSGLSANSIYYGTSALTAITDNAAITYLFSLVEGISNEFKYAVVAGAVTGGGLTVIANAPNPAGYSILKKYFEDGVISATNLFVAATIPTLVAIIVFKFI